MFFGSLKRKMDASKGNPSPSDCASAFKKVSIENDPESSVRSGSTWTSMQSYSSWRSDDSTQDSTMVFAYPLPDPVLPHGSAGNVSPRDAFVTKTITQLKNWMPGKEKDEHILAEDMELANEAISQTIIPDNVSFVPVHASDPLLAVFGYLGVDAIAIALGASYFQRLLHKKQSMMQGAKECGWFVKVDDGRGTMRTFMRSVHSEQHTGLMVIYAVCCYIAAKLADRVTYKRQLSALLYALLDCPVEESVAVDLEARVLAKLEWRLGPTCECQ